MDDQGKSSKRFAFFTGCLVPSRFPRFEAMARELFPELGIELIDITGFSCCPDPVRVGGADRFTWLVMAARNLAVAAGAGLPVLTLCPACTVTLASANAELERDAGLLAEVNHILAGTGRYLAGPVRVRHFLKVFWEDIGLDGLRATVTRPLHGFRLSYHSGCHENSPRPVMEFDNPFNPQKTERMLDALGVTVVDYPEKSHCCGSPLTLDGKQDDALRATVRKVADMKRCGADALAAGCASCFQQFEIGQMMASRKGCLEEPLPVFHVLEILALAMGRSLDDIGFGEHKIKGSREMLEEKLGGTV
ncbi:MAG: hypothetical protein JXO48_10225 [Deltaproteobacteria bacterium]|nr:hypothetical protein [Deltaproteobacteria bacterium]